MYDEMYIYIYIIIVDRLDHNDSHCDINQHAWDATKEALHHDTDTILVCMTLYSHTPFKQLADSSVFILCWTDSPPSLAWRRFRLIQNTASCTVTVQYWNLPKIGPPLKISPPHGPLFCCNRCFSLSKVHPPIYATVHAVILRKKHQRSSTVHKGTNKWRQILFDVTA